MLVATRAIVLHSFKYSDTSLIVHLYTEQFGRQSCILKGAFSKRAAIKANLFQPLFLLDIVIYKKENRELNIIKEARIYQSYTSITYSNIKTSIALFLSEILYKSLRNESSNQQLFAFLTGSLQLFDIESHNIPDFHVIFMIQLSKYLGFFPSNNYSEAYSYFDMVNGVFVDYIPSHGRYSEGFLSKQLSKAINVNISGIISLELDRRTRVQLLQLLVDYYHLHIHGMSDVKSLSILSELFD